MNNAAQDVSDIIDSGYEHGFITPIESDTFPPGLDEEVIRHISAKKQEPEWMLERRLKAYRHWLGMTGPDWAHLNIPPIEYQAISYFSAPRKKGDGP